MFHHSFSPSIISHGIWYVLTQSSIGKTPAEIVLNLEITTSVLVFAEWKLILVKAAAIN